MKTSHYINFEDTATSYHNRSTAELKKMKLLFRFMSWTRITKILTSLLIFALKIHFPIKFLIKKTVFKQFCGGETFEECIPIMDKLYYSGIRSIPDIAYEGKTDADQAAKIKNQLLESIKASEELPMISYMVFKMTSLVSADLLQKKQERKPFTPEEQMIWTLFKSNFFEIIEIASQHHVRVMIDAEESWIQDSIDALCIEAMEEYNLDRPIVFMTIQLYRKDGYQKMIRIYESSLRSKYKPGFKLVRGAYMEKENARAIQLKYESPIHRSKQETDEMFDQAVEFALNEDIAVLIGTHNQLSIEKAILEMDDKDERQSGFAQLYGMGDNLTYNLAMHGFKVSKYLPYGPVKESMPYLIRRAQENNAITKESSRELKFIQKELERRLAIK
jgi:proline dehydrogenase